MGVHWSVGGRGFLSLIPHSHKDILIHLCAALRVLCCLPSAEDITVHSLGLIMLLKYQQVLS